MRDSPPLIIMRTLPDQVELRIESSIGGTLLDSPANVPATVTIGEMGHHLAQANVPILGVQWAIYGGNPVAGYVFNQAFGQVIPLTPPEFIANPLTFAFTTAGTYAVRVLIETAYGMGYAFRTFTVTEPQINFFDSQTATVGLQMVDGKPWIMFGDPGGAGPPGITMNAVLFGQQSAPGRVGILQLATNQRTATGAGMGEAYHNTQNGMTVLDVGPGGAYTFYQGVIDALPVGGNAQVLVDDGPGSQLGPPFTLVSIGDAEPGPETYQSFLMFCADSPGAIWVPLSVLSWSWEGYTRLANGVWQPVSEPRNAVNPAGMPTNQFPTWTANTTTGVWAEGPGMNV